MLAFVRWRKRDYSSCFYFFLACVIVKAAHRSLEGDDNDDEELESDQKKLGKGKTEKNTAVNP